MNFTFSNNYKKPNITLNPKMLDNTKPEIVKISPHQFVKYNMFDRIQNNSPCKSCGK
jgi:predicted SprT family Zn-dependent metalloprotease